MTPSEIHEQLAELDHTLTEHTDVLMRARADLDAAQAEIQTIEAGWADMLIDIAFGRQEAQAKTQARARLRDLRHEVADAEILLGMLQARIERMESRRASITVALRDREETQRQREIEREATRLAAEGVARPEIMRRLRISRDHLRKIVPEVGVVGPTGGWA